MKTYREKLKDPRWQKKRLEVLNAAEFACQRCFDSSSTLHVHHRQYIKGREPWEYEAHELTALCESCHELEHETKADLNSLLSLILPMYAHLQDVAGLVAGYAVEEGILQSPEAISFAKSMREKYGEHCFDGGVFAAQAMRRMCSEMLEKARQTSLAKSGEN